MNRDSTPDWPAAHELARDLGFWVCRNATVHACLMTCMQNGKTEREALMMMVRELNSALEATRKRFEQHLIHCNRPMMEALLEYNDQALKRGER